MSLRYYLTFIDEEPQASPDAFGSRKRGASCPADFRSKEEVRSMWTEACREQALFRSQVAQLRERADHVRDNSQECNTLTAPSLGSVGHPQLCRRPCAHFAKNAGCPRAKHCAFCHLPHRHVSLDKRMREQLASCSEAELLWTLRPHFQRHALANPAAVGFQELLDRNLALHHPQPALPRPSQSWQLLEKRLVRLPLAALVGLCFRVSGHLPGLLQEQLRDFRTGDQ
ncbi:unnamed protein product [Effrenium voratum]|uniref:C3H1-type domain-containing protein n=1 Tax=Effrenium voratum TaxID=2562239 RepID=A0AA36ITV2_9DINO|nr:unnamed protein product [Effrenium voratum]